MFFTLQGFERAGEADREFLKGMTWPTDDILEYWRSILAPPKGLHQSGIRSKLFSVEDLPGAIQYSGTSLTKNKTILTGVLSFVLEPLVMPVLCALSRAARKECMGEGAWEGSIVDASKIRPVGYKSYTHWKLWKKAQFVVSGAWANRNVSLMMAPDFKTWCWELRKKTPWVKVDGKFVAVSQMPVPTSRVTVRALDVLAFPLSLGFVNSRNPRQIVNALFNESPRYFFFPGRRPDRRKSFALRRWYCGGASTASDGGQLSQRRHERGCLFGGLWTCCENAKYHEH